MATQLGDLLRGTGRYEEALAVFRTVLEMEPERADGWAGVGAVYAEQGRLDDALQAYRRVPGKGVQARVGAAVTLARLGRREEARQELSRIVAESRRRYVRGEQVAAAYAALEEPDSAFAWLERASQDRSAGLVRLKSPTAAAYWDPIRADP